MPIIGIPTPPPAPASGPVPGTQVGAVRVDVGAIQFGLVDEQGVMWVCEDITGWHGGSGVIGPVTQKPTGHGAWLGPAWYTARAITIEAVIIAPDPARRDEALLRLSAALPLTPTTMLRVQEEPQPLQSLVRRGGVLEVDCDTRRTARVQIPLLAPDPRRYISNQLPVSTSLLPAAAGGAAPPLTPPIVLPDRPSGGRLTVIVRGDMPAPWTARITGPVTRPVLANLTTGRSLALDMSLAAGEWLDLDARAGTVLLNGAADRSGRITFDTDWFPLALGVNDITLSALATGSSSPTISFTPFSCRS